MLVRKARHKCGLGARAALRVTWPVRHVSVVSLVRTRGYEKTFTDPFCHQEMPAVSFFGGVWFKQKKLLCSFHSHCPVAVLLIKSCGQEATLKKWHRRYFP